ncbi:GFA family protein [Balneatrix alpica]|uniref:GFA family protein n=1 Tax=Balneatrix alpica TaxID=75684 RepID=A0ABV5ZF48_9GAMM|nr:GFA family protein [Balneatrix alpica]
MSATSNQQVEGQCLCGAVTFQASQVCAEVGVCHCGICRRWGGGPFLAVEAGTQVTFQGQEQIGLYASSEWAERGFCKSCGTHLFYRLKEQQTHFIPVGLINDLQQPVLDHQIFIDKKPSFYDFANVTTNLTEAEVFARYAPE